MAGAVHRCRIPRRSRPGVVTAMAQGRIEFYVAINDQGSIRSAEGDGFVFTSADLIGLKAADLRPVLKVEFQPGPGGRATRIRDAEASSPVAGLQLEIPPDLPVDHPVFRQPPVAERLVK